VEKSTSFLGLKCANTFREHIFGYEMSLIT
jgi:hypothetical protein